MKATAQLPSDSCICFNAITPCEIRGCSNVTNPYCNSSFDGDYEYGNIYYTLDPDTFFPHYVGCNCPLTSFTASHNAYYMDMEGLITRNYTHHNYTTCTSFGGNARDLHGRVPIDVNNAIDCCNFCCGRNDSYPATTTTSDNKAT
jgi:hypothetical protein